MLDMFKRSTDPKEFNHLYSLPAVVFPFAYMMFGGLASPVLAKVLFFGINNDFV